MSQESIDRLSAQIVAVMKDKGIDYDAAFDVVMGPHFDAFEAQLDEIVAGSF